MKHYKVKPDKIETMKRQIWIRLLVIIILGAGIEILLKLYHGNLSLSAVGIMAIVLGIVHFRDSRRKIKTLDSFLLTITDSSLIRVLKNTPDVEISFKDINQINRTYGGGFNIKGRSPLDNIYIPPYIENYGSLEKSLYHIRPINNNTINPIPMMLGLVLLCASSLIIFAETKNKILIAISGFIITSLLILFIVKVQRNKNIDKSIRRSKYPAIIFVILIFIVTLSRIF